MFQPSPSLSRRPRRFWLAEALLVAAILAFGAFAALSDSRLSPQQLLNGFSEIVGR
ncbi:MAG TPA: hypothetical protein VHZ56_04410 [Devosia sp.]|jgi:hypothetical protein|nr:hypothetical protein [Devosia sp.]